jgi:GNAT superfamily N-acetyltransferase
MDKMTFREACKTDIEQIQLVRNAVKENTLSNPALITDADCLEFMTNRGKGWVCEIDEKIVGFSIADLIGNNIWALFVMPGYDKRGIGRRLHEMMLEWYFNQTADSVWLETDPGTRAEHFYRKSGWSEVSVHEKRGIKFEMTFNNWNKTMKHRSE